MLTRILSAAVGIPLAILLIFLPGGMPFAAAVAVLSVLGSLEFFRGVSKTGAKPYALPGAAACLVLTALAWFHSNTSVVPVLIATLTFLFVFMLIRELQRDPSEPVKNVGASTLGVAYAGGLFAHLILLRGLPGSMTVGPWTADKAAWLVMFVFLSTWACDTFAYFIGRKWGKKKLIPKLSPGKSVEGSIAGFAGSTVVAMLAGTAIHIPVIHSLILGAAIGILCQVGDFVESAMKREIGIKDFGAILPGHGGVLDRFDSLLFTSTVTYYYAHFLLKGWLG